MNFIIPILVLIVFFTNDAALQTSENPADVPGEDFVDRGQDGSYRFGYKTLDAGAHFHTAAGSRDNTVSGRYGYRDPSTRRVVQTTYTAGARGFRARGPDIARQMDLSQTKLPYQPPVPQDSPNYQPSYSTYFDPNEDPSYKFGLKTPTYTRSEAADSKGTVSGSYSFVDDVGKRHDVQYEAGANGYNVKSPFPDSDPYGGLFYQGPNKPGTKPRGHSAIVRSNDGSYKFTASGPDQKRTEVSDASGRVRGSYTYVDDKGVQRTVQYIAGPNIGYKVIRKGAGPVYSSVYPYSSPEFLNPTLNDLPNIANIPNVPEVPDIPTSTYGYGQQDLFEPASNTYGFEKPDEKPSYDDFSNKPSPAYDTSTYQPATPTEKPGYSTQKPSYYQPYKPSKPDSSYDGFQQSQNTYQNPPFGDDLFGKPFNTDNKPISSDGYNKPSSSDGYNRPSSSDGYNRPSSSDGYNRPSSSDGYNKPSYNKPSYSNADGFSKPFGNADGYSKPSYNSLDSYNKPFGNADAYNKPSYSNIDRYKPDNSYSGGSAGFETKKPSNGYIYPKPDNSFDEQDDSRYSSSNRNQFRIPPGVTVKAHVQSLDTAQYGSKIPAPDEVLQQHLAEERRDR